MLCAFLGTVLSLAVAQNGAAPDVVIYGLKGPSGVGMIQMFEKPPVASGMNIRLLALPSADLMAARFISGEAKAGILPPNVAAKIASTGKPLQVAAVTGNGMLSLLTSDASIRGINDLRGKTVTAAGQGAVPEYVFRTILAAHKIEAGAGVKIDYSLAYPEIAASLIADRIATALIPEPFASMALQGRPELRPVADVQAEWAAAVSRAESVTAAASYPMTVFVVDAVFARENPAAMRVILQAYQESIDWVVAHPKEAGVLVEKHDMGLRAPVVTQAVPKSAYTYIPAAKARPALEALFRAFLDFDPVSIGGKLPGDGFYFVEK
jgi:NitT/TauT family transport system substrate-binding protein